MEAYNRGKILTATTHATIISPNGSPTFQGCRFVRGWAIWVCNLKNMDIQEKGLQIINNPNDAFLRDYLEVPDGDEQIVYLALVLCANNKGQVSASDDDLVDFVNKNLRLLKEKKALLNIKLKQYINGKRSS